MNCLAPLVVPLCDAGAALLGTDQVRLEGDVPSILLTDRTDRHVGTVHRPTVLPTGRADVPRIKLLFLTIIYLIFLEYFAVFMLYAIHQRVFDRILN